MNLFSRTISNGLLIALLFQSSSYAVEDLTQSKTSSRCFNLLKNTTKTASAVGLALAAHVITELPIVWIHEYGHHIGNRMSGGSGGKIFVECNLHKHPLAVLMPFFAAWGMPQKIGNQLALLVSGPLAGIGANYAIMACANGAYSAYKGGTKKEILRAGLTSPVRIYTSISNEIMRMGVSQETHKSCSFSEIFMSTFNVLKSSKMFGEFLYGLTPISIDNGDGKKIWQMLGLKKDMTVTPFRGLFLATIPTVATVVFGMARGIHLRLKR